MFPSKSVWLPVLLASLVGCRAQVQHGLEERDANEVTTALVRHGLDATKVPEKGKKPTFAIEVPGGDTNEALRVLTELKLPRARALTTKEVVAQGGLVESQAGERLKQLEAQEGDLEQALESMDGVASASVELVVPAPSRPGQPLTPSKAAVLVRVDPEAVDRLMAQKAELRALVAAGVEGLKVEEVVLVVDTAVTHGPTPPPNPPGGLRPLVIALGVATSLLSLGLIGMAVSRRRSRSRTPPSAPAAPSTKPESEAPPRPVVAPALQRKAA